MTSLLWSSVGTIGGILAAMALVALLETAIPLHARGGWNTAHLRPNLVLTFLNSRRASSSTPRS